MAKKYDFKYIVIGSGPAGSAAALTLIKSKKRVALVEGRFYGGSNLNTRDLPYKVALDFSHTYAKINTYPEFKNQDFSFNFSTIAARELNTITKSGGNDKKIFEDAGIVCIDGYANFLDQHTIAIGQQKITAEYFIIATGSNLKTLGIAGTEHVDFLTPNTAIRARRLPKVITVVGGGSTGCEIAEYYAELGAKVLILETSDQLLPREDKEVGEVISNYFTRRLGISVLTSCKVVSLEEDNFSKYVVFQTEGTEKMIRTETIILATGSEPVTDFGLENADVKYKKSGIIVNKLFQTSSKNIYAVGDCLGGESSTERAYQEGLTVAINLVNKTKTAINYKGMSRLVNTCPEVATVGLNENDLLRRDCKFKKAIIKLDETTASKIYNFNYGFVKLLVDKNSRILGATIVAPNASLMIGELSLAIRHDLSTLELASTPHVNNAFSEVIKLAAKKLLPKKH
ncbi:NAD(P)/FAD-dependent oxidoreductase [Candidatus Saccharibacteria bacterium]|nr:NAD(P)/FAD-dependent oxidoreductase [Candidatus Saccharibacteria bacterium]